MDTKQDQALQSGLSPVLTPVCLTALHGLGGGNTGACAARDLGAEKSTPPAFAPAPQDGPLASLSVVRGYPIQPVHNAPSIHCAARPPVQWSSAGRTTPRIPGAVAPFLLDSVRRPVLELFVHRRRRWP